MVAAHRPKPPDKQELCRKVTTLLKKVYHGSPPKQDLPVLESMLYAICFEDTTPEMADVVYKRLMSTFPDLNEARVSSITELQAVFHDQESAAWRALRVKNLLQFAFDANYSFELEGLKRKTQELAVKQLSKIPGLSWFVRGWALQNALGSHVLPIDPKMHAALLWMGLVEYDGDPEQASESLRPYIRKADAPQFCLLLRCLALDPKRSKAFWPAGKGIEYSYQPDEGVHRLEVLLTKGLSAVPKPTSVKPAPTAKSKAESAKAEAAKVEPAKVEATKSTGSKGETQKSSKGETARAEASRAGSDKSAHDKAGAAKAVPAKKGDKKGGLGKPVPAKAPSGKSGSKGDSHSKTAARHGSGKPDTKSESKHDSRGEGRKRS